MTKRCHNSAYSGSRYGVGLTKVVVMVLGYLGNPLKKEFFVPDFMKSVLASQKKMGGTNLVNLTMNNWTIYIINV